MRGRRFDCYGHVGAIIAVPIAVARNEDGLNAEHIFGRRRRSIRMLTLDAIFGNDVRRDNS